MLEVELAGDGDRVDVAALMVLMYVVSCVVCGKVKLSRRSSLVIDHAACMWKTTKAAQRTVACENISSVKITARVSLTQARK